jgi:hypothetical protein
MERCVSATVLFRVMGNEIIAETREARVLDRALDSLRRAFPPEWGIDVTEANSPDHRGREDLLFVRAPGGTVAEFVVEVKSMTRGSASSAVRAAEAASLRAQLPAVVLTDFANPALRQACSDRGVGLVDGTGWVMLRNDGEPGLLVNLQGAQRFSANRGSSAIERLDGPGASKVIRALWEVHMPIGVRELAEYAQVSPGTIAKVLPTLAHAGAVERDKTGVVTGRNRRLLLDRWAQDYSFTGSNRDVLWLLAPRGVESVDSAIVQLPQSTTLVSTGSLGARNMLSGDLLSVTPLTLLAYYTADPVQIANRLGLRPSSPAAANVVLARPRDPDLLRPIGHGSVLSVPPVQVLADLMTMGGRFPDEADQLFDSLYPDERQTSA